jgi:predicted nucleic acid-binding Zn ribbon protein
MAMIDCPECGEPVSDKANTCPKCGIGGISLGPDRGKQVTIILAVIIVPIVIWLMLQ